MKQFIALVITYGDAIKHQEHIIQQFWSFEQFSPYNLFKKLDQYSSGRITIISIQNYLQQNKININKEEAKIILQHFDKDGDGIINFCDFYQTIQIDNICQEYNRSSIPNNELEISEKILLDLFISLITWRKVIEEQKDQIKDQYLILNKLFSNHNKICIRRFNQIIQSHYKVDKEIILRVFKLIDKKKEQKITKFDIYQTLIAKIKCQQQQQNKQINLIFEDDFKFEKYSIKSTLNTESDI